MISSDPNNDYKQLYKSCIIFNIVIVVGDASVGKTHLIQKFVKGYPPKNPMPTIGV
jgi:GTPase SAR1 family protein